MVQSSSQSVPLVSPEALLLHGLLTHPGISQTVLRICLKKLTLQQIVTADETVLEEKGLSPTMVRRLKHARVHLNWQTIHRDTEQLRTVHGLSLIEYAHEYYPKRLREIPDYPLLLYARGNLELLSASRCVAVVGSRSPTSYGKQVVGQAVGELVRAGLVVVSGLAFGIDRLAHVKTLDCHGRTIAVLGSAVTPDGITPRSNSRLAEDIIIQGGAVLSEYPPGTSARKEHFPARNRIIAGLCQATLVIEAADKSGSLITARLAAEYNREVLAVPGSILSPLSVGTNQLLAAGARPWLSCQSLYDALEYWQTYSAASAVAQIELTPSEVSILRCLTGEPISLEQLVEATAQPVPLILSTVTQLTLKQLAADVGGGWFIKL